MCCVQIDENWYLRTQIYPGAAPIIARLPMGPAEGYSVTIQVPFKPAQSEVACWDTLQLEHWERFEAHIRTCPVP